MASVMGWWAVGQLLKRDASDADPDDEPEAGQKEIFTSWALSILIILLIIALFTSYILHTRKIQAVHETVLSIFAGTLFCAHTTLDACLGLSASLASVETSSA
jgi:sodium/hydrogen exchanger-like protein 6/7